MNIIIACLNSKYVHASLSPWCLAAGLKAFCKQDYTLKVKESTINADIDAFAQKTAKENPDLLALSCYIWNVEKTLYLAKKVKDLCGCKIALGGPEVAYRQEAVLSENPFVDFVLSGEGEFNFPKLIDALHTGNLSAVDGLSYRFGGKAVTVPVKEYTETPPSPYSKEFFEALGGRISYIETSRGCPYRCAFCLSGRCSTLRFFDMDTVKKNLLLLSNSNTKTVKFVDRTFNANSKRANEILSFIKENYGKKIPKGICFHFEIAGDILTDETLLILSEMPIGAVQLEIGMQSFNEETLKEINRKTNTKKLIANIKKLVGFGNMHIHIDLIAGLPKEDIESFRKSFNIAYGLKANMLQLGFLKLLYGADMRENREKYPCEFTASPPYEVTSTAWLTNDEIRSLKGCEDALDRLYNSGRFLFSLEYLLESTAVTPFDLFLEFGTGLSADGLSLSDYAVEFFDHFKDKCDAEILREKIVCDLLCSTKGLHIPKALTRPDKLYKQIKLKLSKTEKSNFDFAILYTQNKVFVVNSQSPTGINGRRQGRFIDLKDIVEATV